jgi:simple sugar transport system permease protein
MDVISSILSGSLRMATPLVFAAIGGLFSERSGIVNIALEGIMLFGALFAAIVTLYTHNPYLGILAGIAAGIIISLIHAGICIDLKGDQIISGTAINILAIGIPPLICKVFFDVAGTTPNIDLQDRLHVWSIPILANIPIIGNSFFKHIPLVYLSFIIVLGTYFILYRTAFGLHLRACGENPEAVNSSGLSVRAIRYKGVIISGAIASLGGVFLSIGHASYFTRGMTAGRGFIALAALILGKWKPFQTLLACFIFGLADVLQIRLQGISLPYLGTVPVQFIQIIPYIITLLILIGFIGKSTPPENLGKPYDEEEI